MSVPIANNLRVLGPPPPQKTDKEYEYNIIIKIPPNRKSSRRRDHRWSVEQKSIETVLRKGKSFCMDHPSPWFVRLSTSGIIPGIVTCGFLSVHGFAVGLCPLYFHADDSCLPAFVMHDAMHFYFHFATQRKTWLRFRSFARKWFDIRSIIVDRRPKYSSTPPSSSNELEIVFRGSSAFFSSSLDRFPLQNNPPYASPPAENSSSLSLT